MQERGKVIGKVLDLMLGKRVDGIVVGVIKAGHGFENIIVEEPESKTVVVREQPSRVYGGGLWVVIEPRPVYRRGDIYNLRTRSVKPWVNGQLINNM